MKCGSQSHQRLGVFVASPRSGDIGHGWSDDLGQGRSGDIGRGWQTEKASSHLEDARGLSNSVRSHSPTNLT
jgi:hypothetical protein